MTSASALTKKLAHRLKVEPLTAAEFAPFGKVIEVSQDAQPLDINAGFAQRFHDLASVDLGEDLLPGGRPLINIFRAQPRALPLRLLLLERHPLGSQAFMPLSQTPYLVVVATGGEAPDLSQLRCFMASGKQGVNYARGTWHHPLLALNAVCDFLVLDRGGPGNNLDEYPLPSDIFQLDLLEF